MFLVEKQGDRGENVNQVILVAHGNLALEMKASAEIIFGKLVGFKAIPFSTEEGLESVSHTIMQELQKHNGDTLIFTDIVYGTPYNASSVLAMQYKENKVEVISGMSLPLIIELGIILQTKSVGELAQTMEKLSGQVVKRFVLENLEEEELEREN